MGLFHAALVTFASIFAVTACKTTGGSGSLASSEGPLAPEKQIKFLWTGANTAAWTERWNMIRNAKSSILVQYFIIDKDEYGMSLIGLLKQKIRDGVSVKLMIDARGTKHFTRKGVGQGYVQELLDAGAEAGVDVQVKVYNPVTNLAKAGAALKTAASAIAKFKEAGISALEVGDVFEQMTTGLSSNHDKILIVDGEDVITGGRNIAIPYFASHAEVPTAYFDADIVLRSTEVATKMANAFHLEFDRPENDSIARPLIGALHKEGALEAAVAQMQLKIDAGLAAGANVVDAGFDAVELLDNASNVHDGGANTYSGRNKAHCGITESLLAAVNAAQTRIWLVNPYVIFTPELEAALVAAADRGVEIRILSNSAISTDSLLTQAIFNAEWPDVLGKMKTARVFAAKGPGKLHAKFAVIDDRTTFVGSYNLDYISQNVNSEIAVRVDSATLNAKVSAEIERFLGENAVEYTIKDSVRRGAEEIWPDAPIFKRLRQLYPVARTLRDRI